MQPAIRQRSGQLRLIHTLLVLMLIGYVVNLALVLFGLGWVPFANVQTGDVLGQQSWTLRQHPEIALGTVNVGLSTGAPELQWLLVKIQHGLVTSIATIPMILLALRLVDKAMATDPFTRETVRRLRVLGFVVLIGGALAELAEYVAGLVLIRLSLPRDVASWATPNVHPTLWWLLTSFVILSVAELVKRGCALRDELDSVV